MDNRSWNLFIDDERWPKDATWAEWYDAPNRDEWLVARSWGEVVNLIDTYGMPSFISFDHDLGDETATLNGYETAQQIVERDMDGKWEIPADFEFAVHSQNPIGKQNIQGILTNYLAHKRG